MENVREVKGVGHRAFNSGGWGQVMDLTVANGEATVVSLKPFNPRDCIRGCGQMNRPQPTSPRRDHPATNRPRRRL
jgi:hypothetical protein